MTQKPRQLIGHCDPRIVSLIMSCSCDDPSVRVTTPHWRGVIQPPPLLYPTGKRVSAYLYAEVFQVTIPIPLNIRRVLGLTTCKDIGLSKAMEQVIISLFKSVYPNGIIDLLSIDWFLECLVRDSVITLSHKVETCGMGDTKDNTKVLSWGEYYNYSSLKPEIIILTSRFEAI
ncbi:hypothetical protein AVEN_124416-1 [Araneus ventricosus]|uniref:Uncharacterized protein n=1 Tax=Araneus ventricosus TaxID=182803 RepID=A0A4Y2UH15_ARAVE|nr:hypothetical protein AVEN_124416-1 [Araneus ventricosus]